MSIIKQRILINIGTVNFQFGLPFEDTYFKSSTYSPYL